jgi:ParB family chromosome partitioning protein
MWKIGRLKDHPSQRTVFGDLADAELAALVDDMRKHGLRHPVEILSDGTVITGHQRVRAAKLLGWKEIEVVIRADLEEAGPDAVEAHLLSDNLIRRQLSPLGRARCIQRLFLIEDGCRSGMVFFEKKEELKAKIASQLHLSLRSVNRYLLILETPPAIQQAFDRDEITLVNAGKVALLKKDCQEKIARRIEAGESARLVVGEHLAAENLRPSGADRAFERLFRALWRESQILKGRAAEVNSRRLALRLPHLLELKKTLDEICREAKKHQQG